MTTMVKFLKYLLPLTLIFMIYIVVSTSLESNLFEELASLVTLPWMRATLWDFYANILLIALWVSYKERKQWKAIVWILAFVLLGSIATIAYLMVQLFTLKSGESIRALLVRRN